MTIQYCTPGLVQALGVLQDAYQTGTGIGPLVLDLYQNDYSPGPGSVLGDFTVADFDGYAQATLGLTVGPYLNPAGIPEIQNASINFPMSGSTTPNTIYGYYVSDDSGNLVLAERFDQPRPMTGPLSTITLLFNLQLVFQGISGVVQPIDA